MARPDSPIRIHGSLLLVQIFFGLWPVAGAAVLREMSPLALVGFRMLLGAPILLLLSGVLWSPLPSLRDLAILAGLGFLGVSTNQILFAEGLLRAGPVNGAVVAVIIPVMTLIIASIFRVERPRVVQVVGMFIAIAGAAALVEIEKFSVGNPQLVGNLLLLSNATAYSAYLVASKPIIARLGALRMVAWAFLFGAIQALPWTGPAVAAVDWFALPGWAIGSLAFILIGPTVGSFALNAYALRSVPATTSAAYVLVQPAIGAIAAWAILDAIISVRTIVSTVVIVMGVTLTTGLIAAIWAKRSAG